jgi:hypothetical protein
MLALSELNTSTAPPALTVSSSVDRPIADEATADTRLATCARTASADTSSISDATTLACTPLTALPPPVTAVTDPALDKDAEELDTEMSAPDPNNASDVSAANDADAVLAAIDLSESTEMLSLITRIDSPAVASSTPPADTATDSELTLTDSPDTSSNELEADTLTLPLPSDDEPSSSTKAPTLPTRTLSLPDTATVDATPITSPELSIDIALADTVTPAPNVADPDAPSTLRLPPAVREPSPPTKPDAEPSTLPDNDDAPMSIEPRAKPLSRPSDATDIDPPTTSTSDELDKLALPPATTSRSSDIPMRTDEPVDTSIDSPESRRRPEPEDTDTSPSPATDTDLPPTLTPAEDDTETSPSAAKPRDPVSKPNELPVPPDTCRDSDATKDT